ncbi:MAG: HAMP domain-containing histidine kinase [Defluviitaleaceae bacterium]|nr:HAMP domain-containing histidine kinase [Defluviitaleaceae bacterium]
MIAKNKDMAFLDTAAALAHEIKNPITLVKANIDLLELRDNYSGNVKNYEIMKRELNKVSSIMMNFITLLKHESSQKEAVYINDVIKDVLSDYQETFGNRINFTFSAEGEASKVVYANLKDLAILFENLIKNSVEAIEGVGDICVNVCESDKQIVIIFADTGNGVPKEVEERLFEDFFTTKSSGSGLGLSICKKIVEETGGNIDIKNNEDVGVTTTVTFPIHS